MRKLDFHSYKPPRLLRGAQVSQAGLHCKAENELLISDSVVICQGLTGVYHHTTFLYHWGSDPWLPEFALLIDPRPYHIPFSPLASMYKMLCVCERKCPSLSHVVLS